MELASMIVSHKQLSNAWKVTNTRIMKFTTRFPLSEIHRTDPSSLSHDQELFSLWQWDDFDHPAAAIAAVGFGMI